MTSSDPAVVKQPSADLERLSGKLLLGYLHGASFLDSHGHFWNWDGIIWRWFSDLRSRRISLKLPNPDRIIVICDPENWQH